ncbi:MAG TPA: hypothetical protein VHF69_13700 [Candidatus Synoicihabitans sp.]|nr:hypothetical protein [Candidatus Synoicihabitans sp.]
MAVFNVFAADASVNDAPQLRSEVVVVSARGRSTTSPKPATQPAVTASVLFPPPAKRPDALDWKRQLQPFLGRQVNRGTGSIVVTGDAAAGDTGGAEACCPSRRRP